MAQELAPSVNAHRYLEAGPVVLVSTAGEPPNLMTMGFHMVIQHPSLLGAVIGPWDHTYEALRDTGECVLAVPTADLAETVVDIGNCSGRDVAKFAHFGLTAVEGHRVGAPLVAECLVNIECEVVDTALVDDYDLFVLEALAVWRDPDRAERRTLHHQGDGTFAADGEQFDLRERMVLWKQFQD